MNLNCVDIMDCLVCLEKIKMLKVDNCLNVDSMERTCVNIMNFEFIINHRSPEIVG